MCSFSGFGICAVLGICSSCLGDSGIPLLVVVVAQQVVSELPRFRLRFFLEIRRASGSDSVEIVCRSQIRGSRVCGIVCRSQKDAKSAQGIFGGVNPVRNSI